MLENYQLCFAFRFKIGINRIFVLKSSLLVLTCTSMVELYFGQRVGYRVSAHPLLF